jgi:quinoprotein glucose dehydrogenase
MLLGDDVLKDWRARNTRGVARVRAYYDVHPAEDSAVTLDLSHRNQLGDPMPKIVHNFNRETMDRLPQTKQHIGDVFARLAQADNGKIVHMMDGTYLDHPAGGCRMGVDPATSVCDSYGRTHDHENLFVVGAPTMPTAGCTNGTLTFVALTLRSADQVAGNFPISARKAVTA